MPVDFITTDKPYFESRYVGQVTDKDLLTAWKAFFQSRQWIPGQTEFLNLSELTHAEVTPSGIRRLADYRTLINQMHGVQQRYLILAPTSLSYGLSRMYLTYCDAQPDHITIVRTISEAQMFLQQLEAEQKQSLAS